MIESITGFIANLFGNKAQRDVEELKPLVEEINKNFEQYASLTNDDLRAKTTDFKSRIAEKVKDTKAEIDKLKEQAEADDVDFNVQEELYAQIDKLEERLNEETKVVLDEILPEAFAVVKETARRFKENTQVDVTANDFDKDLAANRDSIEIKGSTAVWYNTWNAAGTEVTWDMLHYDVQLIGGMVLHQGKIAEMATGEGKTLVATLPIYLNALSGLGVHVVTVNNYLAKRDCEWMGPLFEFHGMRIDCIDRHDPNSEERRQAYLADITYGTNNEFGFDYLRDNMAGNPSDLVQRKHNYTIVDEVDSVLIDDARTPLIISGPTPRGDQHEFTQLKPKVEKLVNAQKQYINTLLADGKKMYKQMEEGGGSRKERNELEKEAGMALLRCFRGHPKNKAFIKFQSEPGVKAFIQKTESYYLQDNSKEMPKVDEELFFVIEEKNNAIEMTEKGIDLITGNSDDPDFFIMPDVGMTVAEIDRSEKPEQEKIKQKDELMRDFSAKSERIHTINQLLKAYAMFEKDVEYVLMDNKVKIVDEQTGRIMEGRRYSDGLHQAIEAKENVKIEAATQTYATVTLQNYFRMYTKLAGMTGTAETEAGEFWEIYKLDVVVIPTNRPIQRADMDDKVYKTKREKYNAVIDEVESLVKEKRPVLVGTTSVEVSELLSRMLKLRNINHNVLNAKLHQREADIVAEAGTPGVVTIATNMAGRGTDIKLGKGVKEAGGLAIVGTERHESRRIDRQLRGRAGRQGDPGSSQFFVSLEDNLMRMFGSDRIAKLMDRMGLEEGEVIQHGMISRSIERAQKKVEENNFGIRKRLLEYDDVMNSQREVIYKKRKHALFGERLSLDITNSLYDVSESITNEFQEVRDFEGFKLELIRNLAMSPPVTEDEFVQLSVPEISERVFQGALKSYKNKGAVIAEKAFPVIKGVYETQSGTYKNIVVPFTDGSRNLQVVTDLEKSYNTTGKDVNKSLEKFSTLAMIDNSWKEHLREMDDLRQSVQSAVYEQKDPLLIYKFESFELFKQMLDKVNKEIISFLVKADIQVQDPSSVRQVDEQRTDMSGVQASKAQLPDGGASQQQNGQGQQQQKQQKAQPVRVEKKVGRNDPCPCGSGKKFKQCHGKA